MMLFDLDNCLFDHIFSLRCADSALKRYISCHTGLDSQALVYACKLLFQKEMSFYMDEGAALQRACIGQTEQIFIEHGLPMPDRKDVETLYGLYKEAYCNNRRAAPGAIQTMARLRDDGYQIASMSSHELEQQEKMANMLGFRHLIDHMLCLDMAIRSGEDDEMLEYAIKQMDHPGHTVVVVRHSLGACKAGAAATKSGMRVMVNTSVAQKSECRWLDESPAIVHRLDQLLDRLQIKTRRFTPTISCKRGRVILEGLGLDLVTERRAGFYVSNKTARLLVEKMGAVLLHISRRLHVEALVELVEMMRLIASTGAPSGGAEISIFVPGQDQINDKTLNESTPPCMVVEKRHSIMAELSRLTLDTDGRTDAVIRATAKYLQLHCNDLMREHPRQAIGRLRSAIITIAEAAGIREHLCISGANIEPWIGSKARSGGTSTRAK